MGYEPDSDGGSIAKMSGKKLAILFGLIFFGGFMGVQMITGFPIKDIFIKESITEEVPVVVKQADGTCVVDATDHPREIENCPYDEGDHVVITYNKNNAGIESHRLAD
ncbi:MAG: hypothetical protein QXJ74_07350 [Nitrososphaera sp.]|uniref:hypothetical protein n=1 Tax=Nitrososphaera sp. TaxID=1971748 RepID=UPI00184BF8F2|nr:hypothetical protein [Nitrososphaera sp.]NWG37204.1 hypothetical protein [Nitrososphaera sp.]